MNMRISFIIVAASLLYLSLLIWSNWNETSMLIINIELPVVLLVCVLSMTNYLLRSVKWHYYTKLAGAKVPFSDNTKIFLAGLSLTLSPGKFGEVVKAYLLKERHGVEMRKGVLAILAERVTDVIAMAVLLGIGAIGIEFSRGNLTYLTIGDDKSLLSSVLKASILVVLFFLIFVLIVRRNMFLKVLLSRVPARRRKGIKHNDFAKDVQRMFGLKPLLLMSLLSAGSWFMECLGLYLILKALSFKVSLSSAVFIFALSTLAGVISMLPGGIGVAELSMISLLSLSGMERASATAATLVFRALTLWFAVLVGVIAMGVFFRE